MSPPAAHVGSLRHIRSAAPHLVLPLGELAAKPTERAVVVNEKYPLRPVCALGTSPKGRGKGGSLHLFSLRNV